MDIERIGIVVNAVGRTGVLHQLTGVIARHEGDNHVGGDFGELAGRGSHLFRGGPAGRGGRAVEDLRALADRAERGAG